MYSYLYHISLIRVQSMSYSPWSDRMAAGSYGGEVGMVTMPTYIHLANTIVDRPPKKTINSKQEVC